MRSTVQKWAPRKASFRHSLFRRHSASQETDVAAVRARELGMRRVPERYRRDKTLDLFDPRLYPPGSKKDWTWPDYIVNAKPPPGKSLTDVAIFDGDGVITDGVLGGYFHDFNWDIRLHRGQTKWNHFWRFVDWKTTQRTDFLPYHEIGVTINAGLSQRSLWESARTFMMHAVRNRDFNVTPHGPKDTPQQSPFIYQGAIEFLYERARRGAVNILASGSLSFAWAALLEGLPGYAREYFSLEIPEGMKLIDFMIAGRPKFDAEHLALQEAERPLSIGDGKKQLVEKLLEVWGVDPVTVSVYTDDLRFDRTLLELGNPDTRFATNIPPDYEEIADAFGYRQIRFDGRPRDERSPADLQAIHEWRKSEVLKRAVRFYHDKRIIEDH